MGEANVLAVAELLREVERCPDELLGANQLPSVSGQDTEVVEDDRREGRVDRLGELVCAFELLLARVLEQGLGAADRRQRVDAELVEIERLRQRQRLHTDADRLLPLAREHAESGEKTEHASLRHRRARVGDELLCSLDVALRLLAVSAVPRHSREKRLRLAGGLPVADLEQGVAGLLER